MTRGVNFFDSVHGNVSNQNGRILRRDGQSNIAPGFQGINGIMKYLERQRMVAENIGKKTEAGSR